MNLSPALWLGILIQFAATAATILLRQWQGQTPWWLEKRR